MAKDFAPLDLLYLYRDQILSTSNRHGLTHPRVYGLVARGAELPQDAVVELLVDVMGAQTWAAVDRRGAAIEVEHLIAHPVALVHCPPGHENLLPGEQIVRL